MRELKTKRVLEGYILVRCPKCHTPKILNKKYRTSRCYRCKRLLEWRKLSAYGKFKTNKEAHLGIIRFKSLHVLQYSNILFEQNT